MTALVTQSRTISKYHMHHKHGHHRWDRRDECEALRDFRATAHAHERSHHELCVPAEPKIATYGHPGGAQPSSHGAPAHMEWLSTSIARASCACSKCASKGARRAARARTSLARAPQPSLANGERTLSVCRNRTLPQRASALSRRAKKTGRAAKDKGCSAMTMARSIVATAVAAAGTPARASDEIRVCQRSCRCVSLLGSL